MMDLAEVAPIPIRPTSDPPSDRRESGPSPRLPKRDADQRSTEQEEPEGEDKHQVDVTV